MSLTIVNSSIVVNEFFGFGAAIDRSSVNALP
jgi:hypothetical protein